MVRTVKGLVKCRMGRICKGTEACWVARID